MEYYVEWMRKEEKKDESDNIDDCDSDGEASASVGTWVKILSSLSSFGLHTTIASSTKRHLSTVISDAVQSLCDEYEDLDEDEIETPSPNSPYPLLEKVRRSGGLGGGLERSDSSIHTRLFKKCSFPALASLAPVATPLVYI